VCPCTELLLSEDTYEHEQAVWVGKGHTDKDQTQVNLSVRLHQLHLDDEISVKKFNRLFLVPKPAFFNNFHEYSFITFWSILPTDKPTNQHTEAKT